MIPCIHLLGFILVSLASLSPPYTMDKEAATLQDLLILKDHEIDLGRADLLLSKQLDHEVDLSRGLKELDRLAKVIKKELPEKASPRQAVRIMNRQIFRRFETAGGAAYKHGDLGFLATVLKKKKGNCMGLAKLYLALGQRIGLPLKIMRAKDHVYVRYADLFNIETTAGGQIWKQADTEGLQPEALSVRGILVFTLENRVRFFGSEYRPEVTRILELIVMICESMNEG